MTGGCTTPGRAHGVIRTLANHRQQLVGIHLLMVGDDQAQLREIVAQHHGLPTAFPPLKIPRGDQEEGMAAGEEPLNELEILPKPDLLGM